MDIVFIRDLQADTRLGIDAWERQVRQRVRVDLELGTDIRAAASSGRIDQAINYHAVATRIQAYLASADTLLVETLAEALATLVLREFAVSWLRLTVAKPGAVVGAREVGITIERPAPAHSAQD